MCPSSGIYRDRVKSQLNIPCVGVVVLYTGIYLPDIPVYTVYTVPIHYILLCILYVPVTWLAVRRGRTTVLHTLYTRLNLGTDFPFGWPRHIQGCPSEVHHLFFVRSSCAGQSEITSDDAAIATSVVVLT